MEQEAMMVSEESEKPSANATAYNRVALLRMGEGVSRARMARDLGVSAETLAYIERAQREPGVILAWRISQYFGLPLELVFSDKPVLSLKQILRAYYLGEDYSGEHEEEEQQRWSSQQSPRSPRSITA